MNPDAHTKKYIIKMEKLKIKRDSLRKQEKKQIVTYKGKPIRPSADFQQKLCR